MHTYSHFTSCIYVTQERDSIARRPPSSPVFLSLQKSDVVTRNRFLIKPRWLVIPHYICNLCWNLKNNNKMEKKYNAKIKSFIAPSSLGGYFSYLPCILILCSRFVYVKIVFWRIKIVKTFTVDRKNKKCSSSRSLEQTTSKIKIHLVWRITE